MAFNRLALRNIVYAIDVSGEFTASLWCAMAVARVRDADLRVVHVIPAAQADVADDVISLRRSQMLDRLRAIVEESGALQPTLVGTAVRTGDPATEVLGLARAISADLLVIGAPNVRTPERPAGPVASVVISRSECPVLTVPAQARVNGNAAGFFTRIVCAVDTAPSCVSVIRQALSLAWERHGHVTFVTVVARSSAISPAQTRDALAAEIPAEAREWCESEVVVARGEPGAEIVRVATESKADIVVIGAPRRWTSAAHGVLGHIACPVLVTHDARPLPWPAAARDVGAAEGMNRSRS
jgi:nucleotide-binding universal stress UspA family protein